MEPVENQSKNQLERASKQEYLKLEIIDKGYDTVDFA